MRITAGDERCKKDVREQGMRISFHRCTRKAVEGGFCRQHAPSAAKAMRAKWDRESKIRALNYALEDAAAAIVDVVIAEPEHRHTINLNQVRRLYRAVKAKLDAATKETPK